MATNPAIRYLLSMAMVLAFITAASASNATQYLYQALSELCKQIQQLIPVAAMLLVVCAAVIYALGQMFGAETRARATVWATSCLTGAVIGVLIASIAPSVLGILATGQADSVKCS
jgi:hypothetical protein